MPKVVIIGSGWSGLFAANYLESIGVDYCIISKVEHGFSTEKIEGVPFTLGQRTLFYGTYLKAFLKGLNIETEVADLSESISLKYKGKVARYPIQNHLNALPLWSQFKAILSQLTRNKKLVKNGNISDHVRGNYGNWLADEIILPHTWKTIKEDLYTIMAEEYGKKVIPFNPFRKKKTVKEFSNAKEIMEQLYEKVKGRIIIIGDVAQIKTDVNKITYEYKGSDDRHNVDSLKYDYLISTIPITWLMYKIKSGNSAVEAAKCSLHYNNLFLGVFIIPNTLLDTDSKIMYFPERKYTFSKITINRSELGFASIVCEVSFRRNDIDLYHNEYFLKKLEDRLENDLKASGIIKGKGFSALLFKHKIISPAYIICDEEYESSNSIIQSFLRTNNILNFGRFAEWKPNLRAEAIPERIVNVLSSIFKKEK